jgi:transcriptional regulator with XRE-family HTH domain
LSPKKLGMTIKRLREDRNLTQAELALKAKVHRVYVAQIEARTKTPSLAVLERIAKALRVPVTELLA